MSVSWQNFLKYEAFLAAANIGYVIAAVDLSVDPQTQAPTGFQRAFVGSTGAVFRVTHTLPRVYLAPEIRVVSSKQAAMAAMRENWNPARVAIVEGRGIPALPTTELTGSAALDSHTDPDRVEVTTETNRPALLVLADNYAKGWKATVDGAPVPILRANYTFRGVMVDGGRHHVAFTFHPDPLYHGLYISLAALALLMGYGVWLVVERRRAR
jgi:hypothetical protein